MRQEKFQESLGDLLEPEPTQMALRGDRFLWREMRDISNALPMPSDADNLATAVADMFLTLTGKPIDSSEYFYVEKYARGSMSSGYVDPEWWRNEANLLLAQRFSDIHGR